MIRIRGFIVNYKASVRIELRFCPKLNFVSIELLSSSNFNFKQLKLAVLNNKFNQSPLFHSETLSVSSKPISNYI
jgi:hypothetical protein